MSGFPEAVVFEVETEDGTVMRGNRYPLAGARAVVTGHGLCSTNYAFDLPLAGFNLAEKLHAMGYEVWTTNWRGSGHPPARSGARDWRHSGDYPGAMDLPAILTAVETETGKRPFYMGHSFGGMTLYVYLQGTYIDRRDSFRVKRDPGLARERNARLAGAVTVGSPVSMRGYEVDAIEKVRSSRPFQAYFKIIENWLLKLDRHSPRIPLSEFALGFGLEHPRIAEAIMTSPLARFYLQPRNMGREACGLFGTWAGGSVSARHLAHMIQMGRLGDLAPFMPDGGRPPFTYTDGIPRITVPLVMVGGGADPIREDRLRAAVFDKVSSEHKRFIFLPGAGHVDQLYLMDLEDIFGWLEEHAGES
jgi:pimeloyl-ACP methyl ester carboxylesterase